MGKIIICLCIGAVIGFALGVTAVGLVGANKLDDFREYMDD